VDVGGVPLVKFVDIACRRAEVGSANGSGVLGRRIFGLSFCLSSGRLLLAGGAIGDWLAF